MAADHARIHQLLKKFTKKLLMKPIGSTEGLRVCLINPGDNGPRVNFHSPQAPRLFYGKNVCFLDQDCVMRTAYGVTAALMSTGFHPTEFEVRPFDDCINEIVNSFPVIRYFTRIFYTRYFAGKIFKKRMKNFGGAKKREVLSYGSG